MKDDICMVYRMASCDTRRYIVLQVPAAKSRLNPGDVFILDKGLKVYQWNGSGASAFERNKVHLSINPSSNHCNHLFVRDSNEKI